MLTALSRDQNYQLGPARFQVGSSNTRVALLADTPIKTSDMTAHLEDVILDGNCGNNGAVIEVSLKLLSIEGIDHVVDFMKVVWHCDRTSQEI